MCEKRFSALVGVVAERREIACPRCAGTDLERIMSRFASPRSEDDRLESLADPSMLSEDDPAAMRQWMKRVGKEIGEEGDDFEEMMDEAMDEEGGSGAAESPPADDI